MQVGIDCHAEGLFGSFHEVAASTAVNVHFNAAGNYNAAFGIDDFCPFFQAVTFFYCFDLVAFDDNRAAFDPALRGEYAAIDDLFQHSLLDLWWQLGGSWRPYVAQVRVAV